MSRGAQVKAVTWYRKAADQGYDVAQHSLGYLSEIGSGLPKDDQEAIRWYKLAAAQGYDPSLRNLGLIYWEGKAVPKDLVQAKMWLLLAAKYGNKRAAINDEEISKEMTDEQIAEAERLAEAWRPQVNK